MIELDLDKIAKRRSDALTDLGTNSLAKAALALGIVDREVPLLIAEIVRLNNALIESQLAADEVTDWEYGWNTGSTYHPVGPDIEKVRQMLEPRQGSFGDWATRIGRRHPAGPWGSVDLI